MADLDERLRDLDRLDAPDLWTSIESRDPHPSVPDRSRRWPIAVGALVAAGLALALVSWVFFEGRSPSSTTPAPASPTVAPVVTNGPIWFQRGGGEGGVWIESVNPDGSDRQILFVDPAGGGTDDVGSTYTWSPDGTRLAFVDSTGFIGEVPTGSAWDVFAMNPDGSGRTQVTDDGGFAAAPSWSPGGTRIVYASDEGDPNRPECEMDVTCRRDLYAIGADGTGQTRLTTDPANDWQPDWGPDGRIVFVSDRPTVPDSFVFGGDLYLMNEDGSALTRLTSTEGESQPRWSPDGSMIAFVRQEEDVFSLYVRSVDGSTERKLASGLPSSHSVEPDLLQDYSWSPDGILIAFVSGGDAGDTLSTVNVATGEVTTLVQDDHGISSPAWGPETQDTESQATRSPAATQPPADAILFALAESDSTDAPIELAYVPSSGGEVVPLTDVGVDGTVVAEPRWSPDGTQIAFVMSPTGYLTTHAGDGNIYVMNADGTDMRRITDGLNAASPAWSPDGSQLVVVTNQGQQLVTMNVDGSNEQVVAASRGYYQWPAWSPDGAMIAYQSSPDGSIDRTAVFTIEVDGSHELQLTDATASEGYPAWSPDGSRIAYAAGDEIWVMNSDGTDQRVVTDCGLAGGCVGDMAPSWAPDGTELVFVRQEDGGGARRLYVLHVTTGKIVPLTQGVQSATWPSWRP
jgi:Tol biopolymer transport system component